MQPLLGAEIRQPRLQFLAFLGAQLAGRDAQAQALTELGHQGRLQLAHLDSHGYADVVVDRVTVGTATRLDPDNPWVRFTLESIARSTGAAAVLLPNLGGSLPNEVFADLLGLPTIWVPHSYAACNQHAPDEHLLAPVARQALELMTGLFWDLGEQAHALPRRG